MPPPEGDIVAAQAAGNNSSDFVSLTDAKILISCIGANTSTGSETLQVSLSHAQATTPSSDLEI